MLCGQQGQMEILVALKERFRKEIPSVSIEVTKKLNFLVQPLHMKINCGHYIDRNVVLKNW